MLEFNYNNQLWNSAGHESSQQSQLPIRTNEQAHSEKSILTMLSSKIWRCAFRYSASVGLNKHFSLTNNPLNMIKDKAENSMKLLKNNVDMQHLIMVKFVAFCAITREFLTHLPRISKLTKENYCWKGNLLSCSEIRNSVTRYWGGDFSNCCHVIRFWDHLLTCNPRLRLKSYLTKTYITPMWNIQCVCSSNKIKASP